MLSGLEMVALTKGQEAELEEANLGLGTSRSQGNYRWDVLDSKLERPD